ncbi:MAG TPA: ABC transporter permease [Ignavibacteria bacterium]|nr:ABC transporter permease [Ignavibacteria bacterium]
MQSAERELKPLKVIEPNKSWNFLNLREIFQYKDLLYFMVLRDVTVLYKQTILGVMWAVLNPFLTMIIFSVIFGNLAGVPSDGIPYPIFSYAALLPWTYFSQSFAASSNSLIQNSSIFTKVYFPRVMIPLTPILSKLVDFAIAFSILILMMIYYGMYPGVNLVFLPLLIIIMVVFSLGFGLLMSSMAVHYRDVRFALPFMVQFLLFLAPVVFPVSLVKEKFGDLAYTLYGLYPMAGVIEGFRSCLLDRTPMPWDLIGIGAISSIIILMIGLYNFRKGEKYFADVV